MNIPDKLRSLDCFCDSSTKIQSYSNIFSKLQSLAEITSMLVIFSLINLCPLANIADGKRTIWGITGGAGTGKTLLLYDIAKQLSNDKKVCIIHSAMFFKISFLIFSC